MLIFCFSENTEQLSLKTSLLVFMPLSTQSVLFHVDLQQVRQSWPSSLYLLQKGELQVSSFICISQLPECYISADCHNNGTCFHAKIGKEELGAHWVQEDVVPAPSF